MARNDVSIQKRSNDDILIVTTLDGGLHALHKSTGQVVWSGVDHWGPLIQVSDGKGKPQKLVDSSSILMEDSQLPSMQNEGVFIPQPTGDGNLYFYKPGSTIKKLAFTVKQLVEQLSPFVDRMHVFVGRKVSHVIALDPVSGAILKSFGSDQLDNEYPIADDAVFIGRTEYILNIIDKKTGVLKWNISYGTFSMSTNDDWRSTVASQDNLKMLSDVSGYFEVQNSDSSKIEMKFDSPVISAFSLSGTSHTLTDTKSNLFDSQGYTDTFFGQVDGTVYMLPNSQMPLGRESFSASTDLNPFFNNQQSLNMLDFQQCRPGTAYYPNCLDILTIDPPAQQLLFQSPYFLQILVSLLAVCVTIGIIAYNRIWQTTKTEPTPTAQLIVTPEPTVESKGTQNEPEPQKNTKPLKSLSITERVIGYGSHGTVVVLGRFENRDVAVKRLLIDYYDYADHEVKLLQESDHHPNVVRYFCKEQSEGFMYIALELCIASLFDVIEKQSVEKYHSVYLRLEPKHVLYQMMKGIHHLHHINIVHRDLKPQNILIGEPIGKNGSGHPRILISDFGLGKKLADDQSSFHHTAGFGGGTVGWRAPECLLFLNSDSESQSASQIKNAETDSDSTEKWNQVVPKGQQRGSTSFINPSGGATLRITRAMDIFSAGCVFFYVLTQGKHPFGDKFSREINVLKGTINISLLDQFVKRDSILAKDLIKQMISSQPSARPDAATVMQHPFFWSATYRLSFIQDVSDRFEAEANKDVPSPIGPLIEKNARKIIGANWCQKFSRPMMDNLQRYRKYDGSRFQDLLRALRNLKHHFVILPMDIKNALGDPPEEFLDFFLAKFPKMLLHCYQVVSRNPVLKNDQMLKPYFDQKDVTQ